MTQKTLFYLEFNLQLRVRSGTRYFCAIELVIEHGYSQKAKTRRHRPK